MHDLEKKWLSEARQITSEIQGSLSWQSPSNIALVKYWGKHGNQLPNNPSISFTLSESRTETTIHYSPRETKESISFFFEGKENSAFGQKFESFLSSIKPFFPFLDQLHLKIESSNTFPHSSGIASSASAMSALVMGILDLEKTISGQAVDLIKASWFSRLASGSASRSVYPYAALWGKTSALPESSDHYAIPLQSYLHPVFLNFRDSILITDSEKKAVSSRAGHSLMDGNPYAPARYQTANQNTVELLKALQNGDLEHFIQITESEALQLHALMMSSNPSFILMKPNSLSIISAIQHFRKNTRIPICFTLDAGPNIHLLYPENYKEKVLDFIQNELIKWCQNEYWIDDKTGHGPSPY
ncbi:MAG: diphosphomevalonate decarboxylase [Bacteroidales bacterium]|nr:diphosphomevalonate decarboxylase [Bacteroidales bacterium]